MTSRSLLVLAMALVVVGCTAKARLPNLQQIYTQTTAAAAAGDIAQRPLIAVPGTLGSRLVDSATGEVIWGGGGSAGISADPGNPEEFALIALPIAKSDEPLTDLVDTVRPAGVLETAEADVLGVRVDINVYGGSLRLLEIGGFNVDRRFGFRADRDDSDTGPGAIGYPEPQSPVVPVSEIENAAETDFNTFQFDYDWRRDIIESAHLLGAFLRKRRASIAATRGVAPEDVRFDLLAHSMGSLVSRYFLMYGDAEPSADPDAPLPPITWAGAEYVERVVFVAPPNAGSVIAMDNLINGKQLGPLQPVYPAAMLATHPSVYQLLPRPRHRRVLLDGAPLNNFYDVALWERMGWGLANPDAQEELAILMPDETAPEARRARAIAFVDRLLRRAETLHRMLDRWAPPPPHLDLYLVVGGGFETAALAEVDSATKRFQITGTDEGDGVVLRASALLDERMDGDLSRGFRSPLRFKTTLFLPDEHVELTSNQVFGDNLLFWLLEAPRGSLRLAEAQNAGLLAGRGTRDAAPTTPPTFNSGSER